MADDDTSEPHTDEDITETGQRDDWDLRISIPIYLKGLPSLISSLRIASVIELALIGFRQASGQIIQGFDIR